MNRVGVLGCGWLGFPLAKLLIKKGFEVIGSTTSKDKLPLLEAAGIEGHLIKFPDAKDPLTSFLDLDILILNIPPGRNNPNVAIDYPAQIISIVEQLLPNTKLIFLSSTAIYGNPKPVVMNQPNLINEDSARLPSTNSGKALLEIENYLGEKNAGSNWDETKLYQASNTVLHLSGLVGPQRHPGRFLAGKKGVPNGDAPVNLIHQEDCLNCIYEIIRQEAWGETFNLSADIHPVKKEFYTKASQDLGVEVPTFLNGGSGNKRIDNQKIKTHLNIELIYPDPLGFTY